MRGRGRRRTGDLADCVDDEVPFYSPELILSAYAVPEMPENATAYKSSVPPGGTIKSTIQERRCCPAGSLPATGCGAARIPWAFLRKDEIARFVLQSPLTLRERETI